MDRKILQLDYALKHTLPVVEIEWLDGSVYRPPLYEGMTPQALVQVVMEESFLASDRLAAQSVKIPDTTYPDLARWETILEYKMSKKAKLRLSQEATEIKDAHQASISSKK